MSITFINNSGLPININTWQKNSPYYDEEITKVVKQNESIAMISSVGEWLLDTYLNKKMADEWTAIGIKPGSTIGKFRDDPCIRGHYSWVYNKNFEISYNPDTRTAILTKKETTTST